MNNNILYSICIPVFNMESTIERCIKSAINQDYDNFEVVVLDNCSSDKTFLIASSLHSPRLKVIRNLNNIGAYGNHNKALKIANGNWVKFLHGDDELKSNCLSEFNKYMVESHNSVALYSCGAIQVDDDNSEKFRTHIPKSIFIMRAANINEFILEGNLVGTPTMTLINREKLLSIGGFDEKLEPGSDADAWINMRINFESAIIPSHLVLIRDDPKQSLIKSQKLLIKWVVHTAELANKWKSFENLNSHLDNLIVKEWLRIEMCRFWGPAIKLLLLGRISMIKKLIGYLTRYGIVLSSLSLWIYLKITRKNINSVRKSSIYTALRSIQIN